MTEQRKQQAGQINNKPDDKSKGEIKNNTVESSSDPSSLPGSSPSVSNSTTGKKRREHKSRKSTLANKRHSDSDAMKKSLDDPMHRLRPSRSGLWLASLALLTAGVAIAGSYWLWQQDLSGKVVQQQQLQQTQQQLAAIQAGFTQLQRRVESTAEDRQSQWQTFQQQQAAELVSIRKQLGQSSDPNWLLAEAEYLIRIANHRLQLADDVGTAISALTLADQRLQLLRDPRLLTLRRQLSDDITRLRAVPRIDITGLALTLTSLQQRLEQLPLQGRVTLNATEHEPAITDKAIDKKNWTSFLADVWSSLKSLVTVRRVDEQNVAITAPEQRGFLYQNLALKLEAARLALLRNDDTLYHQSLSTTNDWLKRYFDQQDNGVQAMLATLQQLDSVNLNRELPPASVSLQDISSMKQVLTKQIKTVATNAKDAAQSSTTEQSKNKTTDQKNMEAAEINAPRVESSSVAPAGQAQ